MIMAAEVDCCGSSVAALSGLLGVSAARPGDRRDPPWPDAGRGWGIRRGRQPLSPGGCGAHHHGLQLGAVGVDRTGAGAWAAGSGLGCRQRFGPCRLPPMGCVAELYAPDLALARAWTLAAARDIRGAVALHPRRPPPGGAIRTARCRAPGRSRCHSSRRCERSRRGAPNQCANRLCGRTTLQSRTVKRWLIATVRRWTRCRWHWRRAGLLAIAADAAAQAARAHQADGDRTPPNFRRRRGQRRCRSVAAIRRPRRWRRYSIRCR